MEDILHVVIPFFNISNSTIRNENLKTCIKYLALSSNIRIYIVEGYLDRPHIENNPIIDNINVSYIKYKMSSILWIKENLINLAIKKLPNNWKYLAWIDSDIIFCNYDWSIETIKELKQNHTVQLFKTVSFLNDKKNIFVQSFNDQKFLILFSYIFCKKKYLESGGHPGFGWAINRDFYEKIGGLFEYNIVGAGDLLYANLCNNLNFNYSNSSESYKNAVKNYSTHFKDIKVNYIEGHLIHLWHGNWADREYEKRWEILSNHNYDPNQDIIKENGIIKLINKNLENDILNYFNRRENI